MKRTIGNYKTTKDFILNKISQITIFSAYTGIDVSTIETCISKGKLISSPFREDKHPSFGFKYDSKGKLKGRDFAGYWWGDCIDAAATVISEMIGRPLDVSNKEDFMYVLKHIVYKFRNIFYGEETDVNFNKAIDACITNIRSNKQIIKIVTRSWNQDDSKYWNKYGISLNFLNTHFVYPIEEFYINEKINPIPKYIYSKRPKDVAYAYYLGQDSKGISNFKIYFPNRTKKDYSRFITNCNILEGILNLERDDYDFIIVTKSTKDRLCLESYFSEYLSFTGDGLQEIKNVGVINIPHETYKLRDIEIDFLKSKCPSGRIISLMDNDYTGIREAIYLRDNHNIFPIIIPKKYGAKDFSELYSLYRINQIHKFVKETLTIILENYEDNEHFGVEKLYDSLPY